MESIIKKTLALTLIFASSINSNAFAENTKETQKPIMLEGGGFPLIGSSSLFSGNLNIKFGFNMENTTFLLSAKQISYISNGPISVSYTDNNGNKIITPINPNTLYEKKIEFQVQERYYPLKKTGLFQPFVTFGLGFELPNQSSWLPIPVPVILGNLGTDIMINESFGINLLLNASFPRGVTPEVNLKLDF